MPGLLSLANELISKIGSELDTHGAFRGTCKQIDRAITPQVLSCLNISITEDRVDLGISLLEALAAGSIRTSEYARTVDIGYLAPNYNLRSHLSYVVSNGQWEGIKGPAVARAHEKMKESLPAALSTLTTVTAVTWRMSDRNPTWATIDVSEFLANLPALRALRLKTEGPDVPGLQLHRVSNLTEFAVDGDHRTLPISEIIGNSPNLTHLDVQTSSCIIGVHTPTLHGLLSKVPHDRPLRLRYLGMRNYCVRIDHETLPHLRALKSLELRGIVGDNWIPAEFTEEVKAKARSFSSSSSEVWKALERAVLPIREIVASVNKGVLEYLESASDIENLAFFYPESDSLARTFFTCVLLRLAPTLISLEIMPAYRGLWCFGEHNKDSFLECTRLKTLSLSAVDPNELYRNDKTAADHTVSNLLKTITELPQRLSQLTLLCLEDLCDAFCDDPDLSCEEYSYHKLSLFLEGFEPINPDIHPETILVRQIIFHLRRCDAAAGGVWRYVRGASNCESGWV